MTSFWGVIIANNLTEMVTAACVLIVAGWLFVGLGRRLERARMRRMGAGEWAGYLADPKRWLRMKDVGKPI